MDQDLGEAVARLLFEFSQEDAEHGRRVGIDQPHYEGDAFDAEFDTVTDQHSMKIAAYQRAARLLGMVAQYGR